jgi:nitrate reductase cytochrome c-type subunit
MSEDDGLPNSRLPLLEYLSQLPTIPNESEEYKQTKGMFKCLGRFLGKLNKKMDPQ